MAALTVVNIIGTAIGFVIPSFFVHSGDADDIVRDNFFVLLMVETIIAGVSVVLIMIFFK